jgi:hypothetical protein
VLYFTCSIFQHSYSRTMEDIRHMYNPGAEQVWQNAGPANSLQQQDAAEASSDHWMVVGSSFSLQVENPPAMSVTAVKPWKYGRNRNGWIAMNYRKPRTDDLWEDDGDGHASLLQSRVQSPPSETSCRFGSPREEKQAEFPLSVKEPTEMNVYSLKFRCIQQT